MRYLKVFFLSLSLVCATSTVKAQQGVEPVPRLTVEAEWQNGLPDPQRANPQLLLAPLNRDTGQDISVKIDASNPQGAQHDISDSSNIVIGAVNIRAMSDISTSMLASSYEEYIGQNADETTLRALAASVSAAARQEGYLFAKAQIPSQSVEVGIVTVQLDPGAIDKVRIVGSDNKRLRKILSRLITSAAQSKIVERQLLLAGDLPGIQIKDSSYVREEGLGVLVVKVDEDKIKGYASLDNYGPDTLGPVRARLQVDYSSVLFDDDIFTANIINTIAQPKELAFINARYSRTLGNGSTVIGVSASAGQTQSGGQIRDLGLEGSNHYISLFFNQALARSRKFNLWLNSEIAYLGVEQARENNIFITDNIVTASIDIAANYATSFGRVYGGVGIKRGLGILGANEDADPLSSRANADGEFTAVNIWANSILNFGSGFGARLAGNGQISFEPLLAPFEITIGGPNFGRGFDFSERFGDEGVLGLAELRKDFSNTNSWLNGFQLYGFVDGGYVSNIGNGFGAGSLISAGGGFRANWGRINIDLQAAAPINTESFESNDRSPKLLFQIGTSF